MRAGEIIASLGASGCGDIRPSCPQSLLSCHFGEKNKDLVQSLRSLWQSLEHCPNMHPTPTYEVVGGGGTPWGSALHGHWDPDPPQCGLGVKGVWEPLPTRRPRAQDGLGWMALVSPWPALGLPRWRPAQGGDVTC